MNNKIVIILITLMPWMYSMDTEHSSKTATLNKTFHELVTKYNAKGWIVPKNIRWCLDDLKDGTAKVSVNSPAALNTATNVMYVHPSVLDWSQEEMDYVLGHEIGHSIKNQLLPCWLEPALSTAVHAGGSVWLHELHYHHKIAVYKTTSLSRFGYVLKSLTALHATIGGYLWVEQLPLQKAREIEADVRSMLISPETAPEGIIRNCQRMEALNAEHHAHSKTHPQLSTRKWYAEKFKIDKV